MKVKGGMLDADGHLIERDEELFEYMEAPYKGNNTLLGFPFFPTLDGYHRGAIMARLGIHKGYTINAKTWLEFLDGTGIESTVLYPTAGLAFSMIQDPTWAVPLARAYNNWFTDRFHKVSPQRLRAVALVPIQDIPEAVKELRRAVTELGMVGMVTPQHIRERNLDHPSFDVVWREAERLGVPVCIHGGGQAIDQVPIGVDRWSTRLEVHAFTHPVGQMIAVMAFTVGGILHRFPKLRVAFLEAGVGWLPFWLERLDEHWELTPEQAPRIDRKPSEYFLSGRCFIGCDPDERGVPWVVQTLGEDVVVYASDYHHWDCKFPDTVKIITERTDLSERSKRRILEDNPRRLYAIA